MAVTAAAPATLSLVCRSCGAELVVEEHLRTATCPYCASPSVVQQPDRPDRPHPTFALGFGLAEAAARERVGRWLRSRNVFVHSGVKRASLEGVRGVYLPAYLYSGVAHTEYRAQIGENYTETYTTTVNGKRVTRTRTRTEWRSLAGRHSAYVADVLVTASRGIPNDELEAVEPFDLRLLRRYDDAIVSGWIAENPSLTVAECSSSASAEIRARVRERLEAFLPGDTHRVESFDTTIVDQAVELCLVPVWVLAARYDPNKPPFRLLVNGQTGEVHGKAPISWPKVAFAVGAGLLAAAAVALFFSGARP